MSRATQVIPLAVQNVLATAEVDGLVVRLPTELERATYLAVNKVLEGLGGAWNRKAKGHVFIADPREAIEHALIEGSFTDPDQLHQFFETPPDVAAELVRLAKVKPGMRVLEPSAGRGAIVHAMADWGVTVDAVELDLRHRDSLLAALNRTGTRGSSYFGSNFLNLFPWATFDAVVMNPPFANGRDVAHVTHALKFLKPGGRLAAVMAAGVMFRMDAATRTFRETWLARGGIFTPLPDGAFKASGTHVRTVIASIQVPS